MIKKHSIFDLSLKIVFFELFLDEKIAVHKMPIKEIGLLLIEMVGHILSGKNIQVYFYDDINWSVFMKFNEITI